MDILQNRKNGPIRLPAQFPLLLNSREVTQNLNDAACGLQDKSLPFRVFYLL